MTHPHAPGAHLLMDLYDGRGFDDPAVIEAALRAAARAAGATVLSAGFHHFGTGAGVTGVLMLAESHISIHTWPERGFAAVDIFMCGEAQPDRAAQAIETALRPAHVELTRVLRGHSNHALQPSR
ncbi:adenosylmethionine decarboxylase [Tropicibacter naphthalenivorans]|nr:adenosylmethionine decarboxylase [Tropicibacter naphthalenivorans]